MNRLLSMRFLNFSDFIAPLYFFLIDSRYELPYMRDFYYFFHSRMPASSEWEVRPHSVKRAGVFTLPLSKRSRYTYECDNRLVKRDSITLLTTPKRFSVLLNAFEMHALNARRARACSAAVAAAFVYIMIQMEKMRSFSASHATLMEHTITLAKSPVSHWGNK